MEEPTVEPAVEPTVEQPEVAEQSTEDIAKEILSTLENAGVSSTQDVQGVITASQQAGNLGNIVGELRAEIAALKQQPVEPAPQEYFDGGMSASQIERIVENAVKATVPGTMMETYKTQVVEPTMKLQNQYNADLNAIQNDAAYPKVQPIWDEFQKLPGMIQRINTGRSTLKSEYDGVVKSYLLKLLEKQTPAIERAKPPHMESASSSTTQIPEVDDLVEERKKITDPKTFSGSQEQMDALVNTFLR